MKKRRWKRMQRLGGIRQTREKRKKRRNDNRNEIVDDENRSKEDNEGDFDDSC